MSDDIYVSKIDRRTAMAWLGAVGAATAAASPAGAGVVTPPPQVTAKGYGTDPNLLQPVVPWPRTLSKDQLQACARFCDFILPRTASAPSASELGVPDFFDEWVSAPYPDQMRDRPILLAGLAALDAEAGKRHGVAFTKASAAQRDAILGDLASGAAGAEALAFFKRFRALTVGAYYTTHEGFKDIGYIGNVARPSDPGPSAEVVAVLERELKKLGL